MTFFIDSANIKDISQAVSYRWVKGVTTNPLILARENSHVEGILSQIKQLTNGPIFYQLIAETVGEMLDEANAALVENARHYLDHPKDIYDRDSFHWHAEMVLRLIELYGTGGSKHAGRITKETEAIVLQPIWAYARRVSTLAKAEFKKSLTWHVYESENHHAMIFTLCWHFSKLAKDRPEYKNL